MECSGLPDVVDVDSLAAFDYTVWLRTGERAAERLACSQSTVSRATRRCQEAFDIKLIKRDAEWQVMGDACLLNAERHVHQLHRWSSGRPLRLETQFWLRHSYGDLLLPGWLKGNLNYQDYSRPLQLIRERVIDALICSSPDQPVDDAITAIPLCTMPTLLLARSNHPLLQQASPLTIAMARRFPIMPLPQRAFPLFQAQLDRLGFHSDFSQLPSLAAEFGHDPHATEDLSLAIASPFTQSLYGNDWAVLPLDLQIRKGDALILHRDLVDHPRAQQLIHTIGQHLRRLAASHADVQVLTPMASHELSD